MTKDDDKRTHQTHAEGPVPPNGGVHTRLDPLPGVASAVSDMPDDQVDVDTDPLSEEHETVAGPVAPHPEPPEPKHISPWEPLPAEVM